MENTMIILADELKQIESDVDYETRGYHTDGLSVSDVMDYASGYISDSIQSYADSNVDIYTRDLIDWFSDNWELVDDAIAELGKADSITQDIQAAQFLQYEQRCYDHIDEIIQYYAIKYMMDNGAVSVKETLYDEIMETLSDIDSNSRWDAIDDIVDGYLNAETEDSQEEE